MVERQPAEAESQARSEDERPRGTEAAFFERGEEREEGSEEHRGDMRPGRESREEPGHGQAKTPRRAGQAHPLDRRQDEQRGQRFCEEGSRVGPGRRGQREDDGYRKRRALVGSEATSDAEKERHGQGGNDAVEDPGDQRAARVRKQIGGWLPVQRLKEPVGDVVARPGRPTQRLEDRERADRVDERQQRRAGDRDERPKDGVGPPVPPRLDPVAFPRRDRFERESSP